MPKQNVAVELYYDGAWHDVVVSDDVYADAEITMKHGGGDEGAAPRPNQVQLSLANDDDKYRPSNPESVLYGKVGLNTPVRVKVGGTIRGIGEASFAPDQTDDFRISPRRGKAWVDVDAGGLTQRINQWTEPLESALRTFDDTLTGVSGHWPMEDERGTTFARSVISGTRNAFLVGHSFGSQNNPPGGGPGVDVQAHAAATFVFLPGNAQSTAGWQYSIAVRLGDLDGALYNVVFLTLANDWSVFFQIDKSSGQVSLWTSNELGVIQATTTNSTGGYFFTGQWIMFNVGMSRSGTTVTLRGAYRSVTDTFWNTVSTTFTGVTSDIKYAGVPGLPDGSTYGHVIGTQGTASADLASNDRWDAFLGHAGELAIWRFVRLCEQRGLTCYVSGRWAESKPMGPQPVDTFPNHLLEIARTDDALIFDHASELALFMLCGPDRWNQTPALTLNAAAGHLASPPREVLDDLDPHNIITASQRDGGDYTARDDVSAMGTQSPPAGRGEYKQTVDVNVADEVTMLPQVARWWLAKGTVDRPRFPSVTVDLAATPSLIAAVEAVDVGSVIEIVGFREYTIRVHVLGWVEIVGTHTRTVTFSCAIDDVYQAEVLDSGRLQANYTVVFPALNASSTTLTLFTGEPGEQWRPGVSGAHIMLGGEEIILGTIGARTGTNPYSQVVTGCTRSVNGVVKAHTVTEFVKVTNPIRLTL